MNIKELVVTGLCKILRAIDAEHIITESINGISRQELSYLSGLTSGIQNQINSMDSLLQEAQIEQNEWKSIIVDAINDIPNPDNNGELVANANREGFVTALHNIGTVIKGVNVVARDVVSPKKFIDNNGDVLVGELTDMQAYTRGISYSPNTETDNFHIRIPSGAYRTPAALGYPEININLNGVKTSMGISADKILSGKSMLDVAGTATSDANATSDDILEGKTAYIKGEKVTGGMNDYSGQTIHYAGYEVVKVEPEPVDPLQVRVFFGNKNGATVGYIDENTVIRGNILLPMNKVAYGTKIGCWYQNTENSYLEGSYTGDANAEANHIVKSETAYVKGTKVTGTMRNYYDEPEKRCTDQWGIGLTTAYNLQMKEKQYIPGTTEDWVILSMPTGFYEKACAYIGHPQSTIANFIGLKADRIKKGITLLGVTGNVNPGVPKWTLTGTAIQLNGYSLDGWNNINDSGSYGCNMYANYASIGAASNATTMRVYTSSGITFKATVTNGSTKTEYQFKTKCILCERESGTNNYVHVIKMGAPGIILEITITCTFIAPAGTWTMSAHCDMIAGNGTAEMWAQYVKDTFTITLYEE